MSDSEDESYCFFGKPLEPYDEDTFPKKKPIGLEDQVARDAQGRRRFHGAFTGGFSAGFFNTVGSLEGWTPSEFKSTRENKALNKNQMPEDFMDEEDVGEFGIAPQIVRATKDYATSKKRKKQVFVDGPIPGEPVLHSLLTSGNETIGYLLLKNIGLKNAVKEQHSNNETKVYGCEMPSCYEISRDDDYNQYKIHEIYKEYLQKPKDNSFGLGYVGLDKTQNNIFQSSKLVIKERNKKKISISGQAFGVGAFEDDDEDIYCKEDMTKYDFELTSEKKSQKQNLQESGPAIFNDFIESKHVVVQKEIFLPPTIPHSFTGKHKVKRSRFEPLPEVLIPERKNMNPELRAGLLGEESTKIDQLQNSTIVSQTQVKSEPIEKISPKTPQEEVKENFYKLSESSLIFDRFVSASKPEETSNILEVVQPMETDHGSQEMRDAARMKMFGPLTRISVDWQPCSLLCKRFNVAEPHSGELASTTKKRTKNLIFEYEQFSDNLSINDLKPGLSSKDSANEKSVEPRTEVKHSENNEINIIAENAESVKTVENSTSEISDSTTKDITEKLDVDKNLDLFKAVFLSSSEESEEEVTEVVDRSSELKSSVLSDLLLSKIKPIKDGILSGMDFSSLNATPKSEEKSGPVQEDENKTDTIDTSYGPALPKSIPPSSTTVTSTINKQLDCDSDEWIEKTIDENIHKSAKKKHKVKKSAHKKKKKHSK